MARDTWENHAAIILAGGQSRRMGRNKALLPLPDNAQITFVEHLATLLHRYCAEIVLVARDEQQADVYNTVPYVQLITDQVADVGPLMGLYTGLSALSSSHALVTAVDMPFIQPGMIEFLLTQWHEDDELLVPVVDNIPQVLCAVYATTLLPQIEQRLHAGRRDPRSLLTMAHIRYLNETQLRAIEPELRSFININTPDDWRVAGQPPLEQL